MSDELSERELEEEQAEALPEREAMSVITPTGDTDWMGDDIVFPAEPDIGDPATP